MALPNLKNDVVLGNGYEMWELAFNSEKGKVAWERGRTLDTLNAFKIVHLTYEHI
ncbi:uncharacterized protein G2W53_044853 [Senna tora]|uniref:Uncharacterized protein n=1 Tax=Senna tora TaxID=362788 RepID=A0A834SCK6_9FABA|nr:uncharacterized protein G2W53_044853 [Senna tora]